MSLFRAKTVHQRPLLPREVETVKHILIECVDLNDVRNKHFVASSIKDVFNNVEAQKNR